MELTFPNPTAAYRALRALKFDIPGDAIFLQADTLRVSEAGLLKLDKFGGTRLTTQPSGPQIIERALSITDEQSSQLFSKSGEERIKFRRDLIAAQAQIDTVPGSTLCYGGKLHHALCFGFPDGRSWSGSALIHLTHPRNGAECWLRECRATPRTIYRYFLPGEKEFYSDRYRWPESRTISPQAFKKLATSHT